MFLFLPFDCVTSKQKHLCVTIFNKCGRAINYDDRADCTHTVIGVGNCE